MKAKETPSSTPGEKKKKHVPVSRRELRKGKKKKREPIKV